jgi:hypothetical protein
MAKKKILKKEKEEEKPPEIKKEAPKKEAPKAKEVAKPNSSLFMAGEEHEICGVKFLVKEIKGIDVIFARKDYK